MSPFDLKRHELVIAEVHRNLLPCSLYEHAIRFEKDSRKALGFCARPSNR